MVRSFNIPDSPIHTWLLSRENVRAFFYEGALALIEKIPEGWILSYIYTFPEKRRQGYMRRLLLHIRSSHRMFAVPGNEIAEDVLRKSGFAVDTFYFGTPFYRSD